ncbi:MAG: hypothetical protein EA376_14780 [Phycisphaeraceae bacterium]|nr:MAG: hypothetical protein EA376_14780 [Phycisphaeraceae bacterium]
MSGISSGVGIFSGIDTRSLINQLLQIEARPKQLAQRRLVQLQAQQAAFLDINSSLLSLRTASAKFNSQNIFRAATATSSNKDAVTATASNQASPGSFGISVSRLVSTHSAISRGFTDRDLSGVGAEAFTFEVGGGRLDSETALDTLNGGEGIDRGKIRITDSSGASAEIDLSSAVTVRDVLDAINGAGGVNVTAEDDGYGVRLRDNAGGAGAFRVEDVFGSSTATSLGIKQTVGAGDTISSGQLLRLSESTALSRLNDGSGVSFGPGGAAATASFRLRLENDSDPSQTTTYDIVLGELVNAEGEVTHGAVSTIGDVLQRIEMQTEGNITASISADGTRLVLRDESGEPDRELKVIEGLRRSAAQDLGLLAGDVSGAPGAQELEGRRVLAGINTRLAANLNGGSGISEGEFRITQRDGASFNVNVGADDSIADIIRAINDGGAGVVTATINSAGNGISITDTSTGADLIIEDLTGEAAADLMIATTGASDGKVNSGNLQPRSISGATALSRLNAGDGVGTGEFRIIDSAGGIANIPVNSSMKTVDDLIVFINSRSQIDVTARINDNGDGILLEDNSGGSQAMRVEEVNGTVAARLNIKGEASGTDPGENIIDGSFEREVNFEATDTLQQVVDKINAAGVGVRASIVNTGSGGSPFRIVFTSQSSGAIGRFVADTGDLDLGLNTLTKGQNAIAFFGSGDPADSVLLSSSTNSLDNVVAGVTIDLKQTTTEPVEINVARDTGTIESTINEFIDSFNGALDRLDHHDRFNAETEERGTLLGDSTLSNIRRSLLNAIQGPPKNVEGQFTRLFQVGVRIGSGARLEFDRDRFRAAFEEDPDGVRNLIAALDLEPNQPTVIESDESGNPLITTPNPGSTAVRQGLAEVIKDLADRMTTSIDGVITQRRSTLDTQIELQERRIVRFDGQLDAKRRRLESQFLAMERALASMQSQQQALGSLSSFLG